MPFPPPPPHVVSSTHTNTVTLFLGDIGHYSKFMKTGSVHLVVAYSRCTTLIHMFFQVSVTEIYFLFFGPENVEQNLRQND